MIIYHPSQFLVMRLWLNIIVWSAIIAPMARNLVHCPLLFLHHLDKLLRKKRKENTYDLGT